MQSPAPTHEPPSPQRLHQPDRQALEELPHRHGGAHGARRPHLLFQHAILVIAAGCSGVGVLLGSEGEGAGSRGTPAPAWPAMEEARAAPVSHMPHLRRTPTSCSAVRVTTLTSDTAHSELSASPRNPNVASSCRRCRRCRPRRYTPECGCCQPTVQQHQHPSQSAAVCLSPPPLRPAGQTRTCRSPKSLIFEVWYLRVRAW